MLFGVTPALKIVGQDVSDSTRQEIAREMRKFAPAIDLVAQYIDVPDTSGKKVSLQRFYTKNSRHLLRMS